MSEIDDRLDKGLGKKFMTYLEIKELEQKKEDMSEIYNEEGEIRKEEEIRHKIGRLITELDLKVEKRMYRDRLVASCSAFCQHPCEENAKERGVFLDMRNGEYTMTLFIFVA